MSKKQQFTLEQVCIKITDGAHQSPKSVDEGLPMASVKDMNRHGITIETCRLIDPRDFEMLVRQGCQPLPGDVLIAKDGASALDTVCEIKQSQQIVLLSSIAILRPNPDLINSSFLRYYLDAEPIRRYMKNAFTTGAAIPRVVLKDFKQVQVNIPNLFSQRKIATILSAYDDLIENNNRRIKILEEMARLIYREWFVNFRFPGHEKVNMVDSPLGRIPEGWKLKSFQQILVHHIGGGWGKEEFTEGYENPAFVIRGTDIPNARNNSTPNVQLRFHSASNLNNRILKHNDIVFEVSGGSKDQPVGRALLVHRCLLDRFDNPIMCASFCKLLRPESSKILPEIVYLHLEEIYENRSIMQYQVQSTGITNFKFQQFLENEMIIIPPFSTQNKFKEIIEPIYNSVQLLGLKNENLRQIRDLLLPKLISGELDVSEMDIEIPEDAS